MLNNLPSSLYTAADLHGIDAAAVRQINGDGYQLMCCAGEQAVRLINQRFPRLKQLSIVCGGGNNAGDGYVVGYLARQQGIDVRLFCYSDPQQLSGEAAHAFRDYQAQGGQWQFIGQAAPMPSLPGQLIVDALLGTGVKGAIKAHYAAAIQGINQAAAAGTPVLALDCPSGLNVDTGQVLGEAVNANLTLSFVGLKQGMFTAAGPDQCGELLHADLSISAEVYADFPAACALTSFTHFQAAWPLSPRPKNSFKNRFGHLCLVGGDLGMPGAICLAAEAAGRSGAGLTSVMSHPQHVAAMLARIPQCLLRGVASGQDLEIHLAAADVIVVGPGLGQSAWSEQLLQKVLATDKPLIMDADALNLLAAKPWGAQMRRDNWILTPHPGEAARLLGTSTAEIQRDRFAAVRALQQRYGGAVILKGNGSLVYAGGQIKLCQDGNPGMACGGMGDVLSGLLGGLLAQGLSLAASAEFGVCLHAAAADLAARQGMLGLQPTDLMQPIRQLLNEQKEASSCHEP